MLFITSLSKSISTAEPAHSTLARSFSLLNVCTAKRLLSSLNCMKNCESPREAIKRCGLLAERTISPNRLMRSLSFIFNQAKPLSICSIEPPCCKKLGSCVSNMKKRAGVPS